MNKSPTNENLQAEKMLCWAIRQKDIASVQQILTTHPTLNINCQIEHDLAIDTPLLLAIERHQLAMVKLLLEVGADVNLIANKYTPLGLALMEKVNLEMLQLLLDAGAAVNLPVEGGWRALDYAIKAWDRPSILKLIEAGVDINYVVKDIDDDFGTLLFEASGRGDVELVDLLIGKGADVNYSYYEVSNPLKAAVEGEHPAVIRSLIKAGANPNVILFEARNCLMYAIEEKSEETAKLLIELGADLNLMSEFGWTSLHFAVTRGSFKLTKLLLEKGAEIDFIPPQEEKKRHYRFSIFQSPLGRAISEKHLDMVRFLIDQGADINIYAGGSPLLFKALDFGHFKAAEMLLAAGVNLQIRDKHEYSAVRFLKMLKMRWIHLLREERKVELKTEEKLNYSNRIEASEKFLQKLVSLGCPD